MRQKAKVIIWWLLISLFCCIIFSRKHGASGSISRARDRRKPSRSSNSHLPPFFLFCHGFEIPFLRAIKGVSLEGNTDEKQCLWFKCLIYMDFTLSRVRDYAKIICGAFVALIHKTWFSWKSCLTFLKGCLIHILELKTHCKVRKKEGVGTTMAS